MSSNLVIVAIPADDDPIWKVSSEKKPHLTICFLGDAESNPNVDRIMLFVEHAVTIAARGPFYLEVDHRDVLGADKADVMMFRKDWSLQWINRFRNQLLKDNDIKKAYESVEQYSEWQPHITLGYPETPAHEDKMPEYGMSMIRFDRIGVWTGDYEGPDWRLEWPEDMGMLNDAAWGVDMEQERKAAGQYALQHVGVKGMKWGVRKTESVTVDGKSQMVTPKKAAKLDKQWEQKVGSTSTFVALHNKGAEHVNARIEQFNKDFEAKHPKEMNDGTLWNDSHPVTKEYYSSYNKMFEAGLNKAAADMGTNPTGTRKVHIISENHDSIEEFGWAPTTTKVTHAATDLGDGDFVFVATRDKNGLITKITPFKSENAMAQTTNLSTNDVRVAAGMEALEHHGVKGMKWGVRTAGRTVAKGAKATVKGAKATSKFVQDVNFESQVEDGKARERVMIAAHVDFHKIDLPAIKAKSEHQTAAKLKNRLRNPRDPGTKAYRKDAREAYIKRLESTANSMKNASGTRQYTIRERGNDLPAEGGDLPTSKYFWDVSSRQVQHADTLGVDFTRLEVLMDEDGWITDLKMVPPDDTLAQSALYSESFVDDYLAHYGVKGMRWGSRKSQDVTPTSVEVKTTPHDRKTTKVEVKGGGGHDAHPDAIKVAEARQKMRKSGAAALSNGELKDVAERLQLESNVARLEGERKSGSTFVGKLLRKHGSQQLDRGVNRAAGQVTDEAATRVGKAATKKIFKAGVAAAL